MKRESGDDNNLSNSGAVPAAVSPIVFLFTLPLFVYSVWEGSKKRDEPEDLP